MKTVLVTGATRGLGLAITQRLQSEGYRVIASGRRLTPELQALIERDAGSTVTFAEFDLQELTRIHDWVRTLIKAHGPIYGLVNNAALGLDGVLATMHDREIEKLVQVNVLAPMLLTKYVSRSMLLLGEGRIVNIASIIGFTGFSGLSVYGATKAALLGFTRSLARELGKARITVNAVAPGYMATSMTEGLAGEKLDMITRRSPLGRLATPEEVARSVAYLLGPDAAMITGTTITVDAGSTA